MASTIDYLDVVAPSGDGTTVEDGIETVTTTATRLPNWAGMLMLLGVVVVAYLALEKGADHARH